MSDKTTHFGFKTVAESEKAKKVAEVFHSVAQRYDIMNDVMSAGLHRVWKLFAAEQAGLREGSRVLDIAGGSGDMSLHFAKRVGKSGEVILTDAPLPRTDLKKVRRGQIREHYSFDLERLLAAEPEIEV